VSKNGTFERSNNGTGQHSSEAESSLVESKETLSSLLERTMEDNDRLLDERDALSEVLQVASTGLDQLGSVMFWFHNRTLMEIRKGGYKRREVFLPNNISKLVPVTAAEQMDASDVRFLLRTAMSQPDTEQGEEAVGFILDHIREQWSEVPGFPLDHASIDRVATEITRRYDLLPKSERGV